MLKLTVITHTRLAQYTKWVEESVKSVTDNLPPNSTHKIEVIGDLSITDFMTARANSLPESGYFCFVDDDDLVVNDSLRKCVEALDKSGAGCAFTAQAFIDHDGQIIHSQKIRPINYFEASVHPQVIHHLCVMRRDAVDIDLCMKLYHKYNAGLEWIMKASTALQHGAIQVPIIGYHWRQHPTSNSKKSEFTSNYHGSIGKIGNDLSKLQRHFGVIPSNTPISNL